MPPVLIIAAHLQVQRAASWLSHAHCPAVDGANNTSTLRHTANWTAAVVVFRVQQQTQSQQRVHAAAMQCAGLEHRADNSSEEGGTTAVANVTTYPAAHVPGVESRNLYGRAGGEGCAGADIMDIDMPDDCARWPLASAVGMYCEAQADGHCGAHALAALLGKQITASPEFLYPELTHMATAAGIPQQDWEQDFQTSGWYSMYAINHWLWRRVDTDAALCAFLELEHTTQCSQTTVLQQAPRGCQAFVVAYTHHSPSGRVRHYKTWMQSAGTWYELESIQYKATEGRIKPLLPHDWQSLAPACMDDAPTVLYALVPLNAMACQLTMSRMSSESETLQAPNTLPWLDGRKLSLKPLIHMPQAPTLSPPRVAQSPRARTPLQTKLRQFLPQHTAMKVVRKPRTRTQAGKHSSRKRHRQEPQPLQPQTCTLSQGEAAKGPTLTVATLNVRGIHKAETRLQELVEDGSLKADILVLT